MFKKFFTLLCAGLFAFTAQIYAQDTEEAEPKNKVEDSTGPARFWQATLAGGHYMVALDHIASVSRHKYILDGALVIDEVTIETVGQALARFYFITPITDSAPGNSIKDLATRGRELIDHAAERLGVDAESMVMKKYPDTSHAKSIEYRILSAEDLTALYESIRNSWETGRGRKFSAK